MENILKYLFPPKCIFCGTEGDIFCEACLAECSLLTTQYCLVCDLPSENGYTHERCRKIGVPTRLLCVYSYSGKVRDCIKFSKYGARQFLSLRKLCIEATSVCSEEWGNLSADLCLPIPSSPKKLSQRGFNQANMIAEEVSKKFKPVLKKDLLVRSRSTEAQHTQSKEGRRENVKGAFAVTNPSQLLNKKVILVDDISTTGATFLESAKVLYEAGAAEVQCFALSKREKVCYNGAAH
ncbi:MAG: amidophosphoribosyltransferase-like protein [uncultured bacterium]|nr:MAG: amidophosphoribosyltransferase-like protein [uncultured bacterium]